MATVIQLPKTYLTAINGRDLSETSSMKFEDEFLKYLHSARIRFRETTFLSLRMLKVAVIFACMIKMEFVRRSLITWPGTDHCIF